MNDRINFTSKWVTRKARDKSSKFCDFNDQHADAFTSGQITKIFHGNVCKCKIFLEPGIATLEA